MKAVYKVTGKNLFKTGMPPFETNYDKEQLHDHIVDLMGLLGLDKINTKMIFDQHIILAAILMDRYGLNTLEATLVSEYKPKERK